MPEKGFEEIIKELQGQVRRASNLLKLLKTYEKEAKSNANPYTLSEVLKKIKKDLPESPLSNHTKQTLILRIDKELEIVEQMKRRYRYSYINKLGNALSEINLNLTGEYPSLYAGLFTFKPNFQKGTVKVFWCMEEIGETKLLPMDVVKMVKNFIKSLDRPFVAKEFYTKLKDAYKRVLRMERGLLDRRVPIVRVLQELVLMQQEKAFWANPIRKNFKEYSRVQFAYDLYRLRKSSYGNKVNLTIATFDQTRDPTKAIFVPDTMEKGARYTYIVVKDDG